MRKAKTEDVAMIPGNNVYGEIIAPHGLETVLRAVEPLATGGRAYIYRSSYSGAETLHLVSDQVNFESDPLGAGEHLFNGGVGGSLDGVVDFVRALSDALHKAGIEHRFEVYDDEHNLVQEVTA
jgi:hypothetical protein